MTPFQRLKNFLAYFWLNSRILLGFSVVVIAIPVTFMQWVDYSIWFWIIIGINVLNLAITIHQYIQYIRFGR